MDKIVNLQNVDALIRLKFDNFGSTNDFDNFDLSFIRLFYFSP